MKKLLLPILLIVSLLLTGCSSSNKDKGTNHSNTSDTEKIYAQYSELIKKAKESPNIETKLFGGFEIGMNYA